MEIRVLSNTSYTKKPPSEAEKQIKASHLFTVGRNTTKGRVGKARPGQPPFSKQLTLWRNRVCRMLHYE